LVLWLLQEMQQDFLLLVIRNGLGCEAKNDQFLCEVRQMRLEFGDASVGQFRANMPVGKKLLIETKLV
jgi:hypothetical protein